MASAKVSITEPHPSVPKRGGTYLSGGRGGAGNYKHYKVEDLSAGPSAKGPASAANLGKTSKRQYFIPGGRGGNGNMFKPSGDVEERMFQFDEEMARRGDPKAPVYHIGRGGMANCVVEGADASSRARQGSSASAESTNSTGSAASNVRGALNRLTRRLS